MREEIIVFHFREIQLMHIKYNRKRLNQYQLAKAREYSIARCTAKERKLITSLAIVRFAEWIWLNSLHPKRKCNIPAPCILKLLRRNLVHVPFAEWIWYPLKRMLKRKTKPIRICFENLRFQYYSPPRFF